MERTGIGMLACKADEHRTIRYVSDSFLEFIGYTREELRTQFNDSFYSLVRREDVAFLRHKLDRQTPMGDEILLEYHLMRKGRGAVQVVERSRLVLEGGVRCSYCEFFDARGPRNVVDSYKRILEAMPAPVVLLDANLRVHFMNRAMEKAVGLELAKCLNLTCAEVFRTPYCNTRDCCCYERYKRNEPFSVRHASDGRIFQVVFSPLKDEAGEVVGIVSVSSDITERCRLEERLREGESRCLVALAQTRNAIWEFDVKTGTLWHLDSELSGYARPFGMESILHDVPESLIQSGRVHSDSVAPLRKMFADIRHGEKKGSCTVKIYTLEGGELWVALTYTTIFNALGGPERAIGLARNVSEEKKREELFAKEREYFTSLLANALAAYEIDLTEDRVLERDSIWPRTDIKEAGGPEVRYSAALEKSVQRLVLPAHRDRVLQTMNPGALIRLYQSGRREARLEYRCEGPSGKLIWAECHAYLIESPVSGNIFAFIYIKDISERKEKELELKHKACFDELTGLYNRPTALARIREALENSDGQSGALMLVDIDDFKAVNDTFGHMVGDTVLAGTASRLRGIFRRCDIVGRLGGDEFIAFLPRLTDMNVALEKADRICAVMCAAHCHGEKQVSVSVSVGIALFPEHGADLNVLYERADIALYHAKNMGKNRYSLYSPTFAEADPDRPMRHPLEADGDPCMDAKAL